VFGFRSQRNRRSDQRNNLGVGVVTLLVISVLAVTGILLPGLLRSPLLEYQISVPAGEDITGVAPGTPVSIAGFVRGEVVSVEDRSQPDESTAFVITIEIEPDPPIYSDARVRFVRDIVSGRTQIDFVRAGAPGDGKTRLAPGNDVIRNTEDGDASLFLTPSAQRSYDNIWASIERARSSWAPIAADGPEGARARFAEVRDEFASLRDTIGDDVDRYSERFEALRARYAALSEPLASVRSSWQSTTEEFERVRELLGEGSIWSRVSSLIAQFRADSESLGAEWGELTEIVGRIRTRWAHMLDRASAFNDRVRSLGEHLGFAEPFADLTIAADQFARLTGGGLGSALRAIVPGSTSEDGRARAEDELARAVLAGMEEAKRAESTLRSLLEEGAQLRDIAGELDRFGAFLDGLAQLEDALFRLRLDRTAGGLTDR
jgi:plasmid stabilization system protein ParE